MYSIILLSGLILFFTTVKSDLYPNSCTDLDDGVQQIKFIDSDEYPVVNVKCSDGYSIIDYNYDNNIKEYFSSWTQLRKYSKKLKNINFRTFLNF